MCGEDVCSNDFKFFHPSTTIIGGMTHSGKTVFVKLLLRNWENLIRVNIKTLKVLWCYGVSESVNVENIKNVSIEYYRGIPKIDEIKKMSPHLIILDDLMDDISIDVKNLFTRESHHLKISVIFIVQNIFNQNKHMRTISLNSHYIILMKGLRNTQQVGHLGKQIFPNKSKELINAFRDATKNPYGYLVIDLHPQSKDEYRLKTRIFKEEVPPHLRKHHSYCPIFYDIK